MQAGRGAVGAFGVLDRAEFLRPARLEDDRLARQRHCVENEPLELDGVGFGGLDDVARVVDVGDLLVRPVQRQIASAVRGQAFDEGAAEHVDGDTAGAEAQMPVVGRFQREPLGQVAVLDDRHLAVDEAEVAQVFHRVALGQALGAHLRAAQIVQPDEQRVDRPHERIVHLEVAQQFHAPRGHVVQRAALAQGEQASAVPVGAQRERVLLRQQQLAVIPDRGNRALHEEEDILLVQAEVLVLAEEGPGGHVVDRRGHDVPGHGDAGPLGRCEDLFREDLEERLVRDGRGEEAALGALEAEARALSTRDDKRGDLPGRNQLLAARLGIRAEFPDFIVLRAGGNDLRRLDVLRQLELGPLVNVLRGQRVKFIKVDVGNLLEQGRLLRRGQLVVESQHVGLPMLLQELTDSGGVRHRALSKTSERTTSQRRRQDRLSGGAVSMVWYGAAARSAAGGGQLRGTRLGPSRPFERLHGVGSDRPSGFSDYPAGLRRSFWREKMREILVDSRPGGVVLLR